MPALCRITMTATTESSRGAGPLTPPHSPQAEKGGNSRSGKAGRGLDPEESSICRSAAGALYRLLSWLSPAFPIGAFAYSHGLEAAAEDGAVRDTTALLSWIAAIVAHGSGRIDADILRDAHRAAARGDLTALAGVNQRALAYRGTAELAHESAAQGGAFLATCSAAWPDTFLAGWAAGTERACYPAAVGAAAARAAIPLEQVLVAYLQTMAANLVSAAQRLGLVGQTDAQRILASLEPVVIRAAGKAVTRGPGGFGAATFAVDLASMAHESQYTRLFRS
jgi:urease accessory protein